MEAAGVALSVIGLIGTFKNCVDLFSYFSAHRSFGRDYELLETKLHIEKFILLQWAHRVRLVQPDYDKRLDDRDIQSIINRILASIQHLLGKSSQFEGRYGLRETRETALEDSRVDRMTSVRMSKFRADFEKLRFSIEQRPKEVSIPNKLRWVLPEIRDPEQQDTEKAITKEDVSKLRDLRTLQLIYDASSNRQQDIAEAVQGCMKEIYEQEILDCLWFRSIDDRRDGVAEAHQKTFQWVLDPQNEDKAWDDFPEWLQSDGGLYWVSGKAGSGKSTLMKYLYFHPKTLDFLSSWADSTPLSIGSFFFWYLGTPEQRSIRGLQRAILYRILDIQRHLIPKLLPTMWQECHKKNHANLDAPTDAEFSLAFEKLSQDRDLSTCFCFFIDGLDEFVGDHRQGALFIERLSKNFRIKVVVSSRPIPSCMDVFSTTPMLRLQDLTRGDIKNYVQATVGSHPYMTNIFASNPVDASSIMDELIKKASGVFLWVVLACRSVISGFAAYDRIEELRRRVDELPPELEDLFQLMLDKVEPRYHDEMARMLKICHQRQVISRGTNAKLIYTLGWAMVDTFKLDRESSDPLPFVSGAERNSICVPIDGRLRSRCGGLLEIKHQPNYCLCGKRPHDELVDSTIEFMHRTVFEFLDNLDTWHYKSLQIQDPDFDPNIVLSIMSAQLARLCISITPHSAYAPFVVDAISCARSVDDANKDGKFTLLARLEEIARLLFPKVQTQTDPDTFSLVLAVESGMVNCVKYLMKRSLHIKPEFPLLYHAIRRGHFWKHFALPHSYKMIHFLLTEGYQPDERYNITEDLKSTPWFDWLAQVQQVHRDEFFQALDITEEFIKGVADWNIYNMQPVFSMIGLHLSGANGTASERREFRNRAARFYSFIEDLMSDDELTEWRQSLPHTPPPEREGKRRRSTSPNGDSLPSQRRKIRNTG